MDQQSKALEHRRDEIGEALGIDPGKIWPTDFGRGKSGVSWNIFGPQGNLQVKVNLAHRGDGTYRLYAEVPVWVQDKLRGLGIVLEKAPKAEEEPEEENPDVIRMP